MNPVKKIFYSGESIKQDGWSPEGKLKLRDLVIEIIQLRADSERGHDFKKQLMMKWKKDKFGPAVGDYKEANGSMQERQQMIQMGMRATT